MGCCCSSPHADRRYRHPAELDNDIEALRYFGQFRNGPVLVPDDIAGLPSCHDPSQLVSDPNIILYQAEIDQGRAWRSIRPLLVILYVVALPLSYAWNTCRKVYNTYGISGDESCLWIRKEYSTRTWYRVYPNRIVTNSPGLRCFGLCGCGSWNIDTITTHPFDRGAFGFRKVNAGVVSYLCCLYPVYGWTVARQRCPCNGPVWQGGWWCEEWPCDMWFCTYRYTGMANGDEVAFASNIALQAYFEGRTMTPVDMEKCIEYWRNNISEMGDPEGRKRDVCCEPYYIPLYTCKRLYEHCCHRERTMPYDTEDPRNTKELQEVYENYNELRKKQIHVYKTYMAPVHKSTICKACGCRRFCGRKGCIFCTEGCDGCCYQRKRNEGDPPPPFTHRDIDDENDASLILRRVLGEPPANVVYKRWVFDAERNENVLVTWKSGDIEQGGLSAETEEVDTPKEVGEVGTPNDMEEVGSTKFHEA